MTSAIYASLWAFLIVWLSVLIILAIADFAVVPKGKLVSL